MDLSKGQHMRIKEEPMDWRSGPDLSEAGDPELTRCTEISQPIVIAPTDVPDEPLLPLGAARNVLPSASLPSSYAMTTPMPITSLQPPVLTATATNTGPMPVLQSMVMQPLRQDSLHLQSSAMGGPQIMNIQPHPVNGAEPAPMSFMPNMAFGPRPNPIAPSMQPSGQPSGGQQMYGRVRLPMDSMRLNTIPIHMPIQSSSPSSLSQRQIETSTQPPTVIAPTRSPTVIAPTQTPTVIAPTQPPTVIAPTQTPTVIAPTQPPTVIAPTQAPTVIAPSHSPTVIAPTQPPTVIAPTLPPTAAPPARLPRFSTPFNVPAAPLSDKSPQFKFRNIWPSLQEDLDAALPSNIICKECGITLAKGSLYWEHYLLNHWDNSRVNNFLCMACCAVFENEHDCSVVNWTDRLYLCTLCGFPSDCLKGLQSHIGKCASGLAYEPIQCPGCPLVLPTMSGLYHHYSKEHWNRHPGFLKLSITSQGQAVNLIVCLPCGSVMPPRIHGVHAKFCHNNDFQVTCPQQGCTFPTPTALLMLQHYRNAHWSSERGKQFICQTCGYLSSSVQQCCRKPVWLILCSYCGEDFDNHNDLFQKHHLTCLGAVSVEGTLSVKYRKCKECAASFSSAVTLAAHVKNMHQMKVKRIQCRFCSSDTTVYHTGMDLRNHYLTEHRVQALKSRYLCVNCGSGFITLAKYFDHQVYEHGKITKPGFLCPKCGRLFPSTASLAFHSQTELCTEERPSAQRAPTQPASNSVPVEQLQMGLSQENPKHAGLIPPQAVSKDMSSIPLGQEVNGLSNDAIGDGMRCPERGCDVYSKDADLKWLWEHYRKRHWSAEKKLRFLCGECAQVFVSVNFVMEHNMRIHNGKAVSHILCPKCGERYMDADAVEDHTKLCKGPRVVWPQCSQCNRFMPDQSCLIKHVMQFHPCNEVACPICGKYVLASQMKEHQYEHTSAAAAATTAAAAGAAAAAASAATPQVNHEPGTSFQQRSEYDFDTEIENETDGDDVEAPSDDLVLWKASAAGASPTVSTVSAVPSVLPVRQVAVRGQRGRRGRKFNPSAAIGGPARSSRVECTFCQMSFPNWGSLQIHFNNEHTLAMTPVVKIEKIQ